MKLEIWKLLKRLDNKGLFMVYSFIRGYVGEREGLHE